MIEVKESENGLFQVIVKAVNGWIIMKSEKFSSKIYCKNNMQLILKYSYDYNNYEKKVSKKGKYYFTLKAFNGQVIGISPMYESEAGRENGIYSVIKTLNGIYS